MFESGLDIEATTITVPGGTVEARRVRSRSTRPGVPLLFLHGGPGGSCDGFTVFDELSDGRDVVMFDQLGSATSTWSGAAEVLWDIGRFCDEVDAVREAFDLDQVVLFGHSWGGWLAIEYLCRPRPGVAGAILADTAAGFPSFAASIDRRIAELDEEHRAAIRAGALDSPGYRAAALEFYRRFVVRNVPGDGVAELVLDRQRTSAVFQHMQGADELHADGSLRGWDRTASLSSIDVPVLVIVGRFDHMDPECAAEIAEGIPNASLASFAQSSHCPHLEEPGAVLDRVATWVASLDEGRA